MIVSTRLGWLSPARRAWPLVGLALALTGCPSEGEQGPEGPQGPAGDPGVDGPKGGDGEQGFATLIDAVELDRGSGECPYGGTRYDMGLDNGDGGGTARDGVLQPGEIDESSVVCDGAGAIASWEVPGGAAGTATIDARGGNGGSATGNLGGNGGMVGVATLTSGGPAAAYATGAVDTTFATPAFDHVYLGPDPLVVTTGTFTPKIISLGGEGVLVEGDVFSYTDSASGPSNSQDLYFRRSGSNVLVTGIRVHAGATLVLPYDPWTGSTAYASVPYDIHNSGTITTPLAGSDRYRLALIAHHYYGDPGSKIDLRGADGAGTAAGGEGGALALIATTNRYDHAYSYWNGTPLSTCNYGYGDGTGGIYNHGAIDTSSGASGTTSTFGRSGAFANLCAADELYNTATITTLGRGGAGGDIYLTGGEGGVYNSGALDARATGFGVGASRGGLIRFSGAGVVNSGGIQAPGSSVPGNASCASSCSGGEGGGVFVSSYGGDVRFGGTVDLGGGDAFGSGGAAGQGGGGGQFVAWAYDGYDTVVDAPTPAGEVEIGASFDLRGGNGSAHGGYGGEAVGISYGGSGTPAQAQGASFLGYASFDLRGGDGYDAGEGGAFELYGTMAGRAPIGFGGGPVVNTVAANLGGGAGLGTTQSYGGYGGRFAMLSPVPYPTATAQAVNRGAIDLAGGPGVSGGYGGQVEIVASGLVESSGRLGLGGGAGSTTSSAGSGGGAGAVTIVSQHNRVGVGGAIELGGGGGYSGGSSGPVSIFGLEVDVSGAITANGGAGATASGGEGGYVEITSTDSFSVVSGTQSVLGGSGNPAGAKGWVWVDGFAIQTPTN